MLLLAKIIGCIATALILFAAFSIGVKALAAAVSAAGLHIPLWLESTANANPIAGIALSASAAAAIAAILAAAHKFELFRESKPHLTVTQNIHHQIASPGYRLVTVTVTMHNTSKVLVKPTKATCRLAMTAPYTDAQIEAIYNDALQPENDDPHDQYAWSELSHAEKTWPDGHISIEPNEKDEVTFQFIIGNAVAAVTAVSTLTASRELPDHGSVCYTFVQLRSGASLSNEETL